MCTNIDFDVVDLKQHGIKLRKYITRDPILSSVGCETYTMQLDRNNSDISSYLEYLKVRNGLHQPMLNLWTQIKKSTSNKNYGEKNEICLNVPGVSLKHMKALLKEVMIFDEDDRKMLFRETFFSDTSLSDEAKELKKSLIKFTKFPAAQLENKLKGKKLNVSVDFLRYYIFINQEPSINEDEIDSFVDEIATCIRNQKDNVVEICTDKHVVKNNIEKLAGYIFVKNGKYFKCCPTVLNVSRSKNLPGNFETFLSKLNNKIGNLESIRDCDFQIPKILAFDQDITNEDVDEFFEKFIWIVKLKEKDMREQIKKLTGKKIDKINNQIVAEKLHARITEWIKEPIGTYLSTQNLENIIDKVNLHKNVIQATGISKIYRNKLEEYRISFKRFNFEINRFLQQLSSTFRILNVICSNLTLAAIQVHQIVSNDDGIFKDQNSCLFLPAKTLLKNIDIAKADCVKLIVVVSTSADLDISNTFRCALETLLRDGNMKIIVISEKAIENNNLEIGANILLNCDLKISFNDLHTSSKEHLMKKNIILQGSKTDLVSILGTTNMTDELVEKTGILKLLNNPTLYLGKDLNNCRIIDPYYMERRFKCAQLIKKELFSMQKSVFLFSNCSVDRLKSIVPQKYTVLNYLDYKKNGKGEFVKFFVVPESLNALEVISELKKNQWCADRTIYWLGLDHRNNIKWNQSHNTTKLYPYHGKDRISEDDPLESIAYGKLILLTDYAGMGKSTVLSSICLNYKRRNPNCWVIHLNLNQLSLILNEYQKKLINTETEAISFLIDKVLMVNHKFNMSDETERRFLEHACLVRGNVFLVLDAVDEVCPHYMEFTLSWIKCLTKTQITKILLTSRPHLLQELDPTKNLPPPFILTLDHFSEEDHLNYLTNFWMIELKLNNDCLDKVQKYAGIVMKTLKKSLNDDRFRFNGIPLQTKLVAEVMQDSSQYRGESWPSCINYVEEDRGTDWRMPDLNLCFLYKQFINRKYDIYFKEKLLSIGAALDNYEQHKKTFISDHTILAFRTLLTEEDFTRMFSVGKVNELIDKARKYQQRGGLVFSNEFSNDTLNFTHRTYAEYLVANYVADNNKTLLNNEHVNKLREKILSVEDFIGTRSFLDMALDGAQDKYLSFHVSECNTTWTFAHHVQNSKNASCIAIPKSKISEYQNCLYTAMLEGNTNILASLLSEYKDIKHYRRIVANLINVDLLREIVSGGHFALIKVLIKLQMEKKFLGILLFYIIKEKQWDILKWCLTRLEIGGGGLNVAERIDNWGGTVVHYAASEGMTELLRWLLNNGGDIHIKDDDGSTALHWAAWGGHLYTTKMLLDILKETRRKKHDRQKLSDILKRTPLDWVDIRLEFDTDLKTMKSLLMENQIGLERNNFSMESVNILRIIFIGAANVGKSSLIKTFLNLRSTPDSRDKAPVYHILTCLNENPHQIDLHDTAQLDEYQIFSIRHILQKVSCIVWCYNIENVSSFCKIPELFIEISKYCKKVPILLTGTHIDKRNSTSSSCVTSEDGKKTKKKIGAKQFLECSANSTRDSVHVINEALKLALEKQVSKK